MFEIIPASMCENSRSNGSLVSGRRCSLVLPFSVLLLHQHFTLVIEFSIRPFFPSKRYDSLSVRCYVRHSENIRLLMDVFLVSKTLSNSLQLYVSVIFPEIKLATVLWKCANARRTLKHNTKMNKSREISVVCEQHTKHFFQMSSKTSSKFIPSHRCGEKLMFFCTLKWKAFSHQSISINSAIFFLWYRRR